MNGSNPASSLQALYSSEISKKILVIGPEKAIKIEKQLLLYF
ncbi:conserved hypothetical protein [delta proteobacterium NaphS2]|nr:conserved hypothetical protein [delta proteobacterium NaphS2]